MTIEIWRQTTDLRRFNDSYKLNGTETRLQQKWINADGEVEWRDVPLVHEPRADAALSTTEK